MLPNDAYIAEATKTVESNEKTIIHTDEMNKDSETNKLQAKGNNKMDDVANPDTNKTVNNVPDEGTK
jgi:hypothetical protein